MSTIAALTTFTASTRAKAAEVNANFTAIRDAVNTYAVLTDVPRTITAVQTFSAAPVFSAGISLTGTLTMATAVSKIVPGTTSFSIRNNADSADNLILTDAGAATFRSTVGGITTLTCTTVTATNLGGTLTTAAQANVTSLGALTALTIAGDLTFSGASRLIIPGTTALTVRNVGNTVATIVVSATTVNIGGAAGAGMSVGLGQIHATGATTGHMGIPYCAGIATGVPAIGTIAMTYDQTNKKIGVYDGGWIWTAALS